jgi:hypothetical protein
MQAPAVPPSLLASFAAYPNLGFQVLNAVTKANIKWNLTSEAQIANLLVSTDWTTCERQDSDPRIEHNNM